MLKAVVLYYFTRIYTDEYECMIVSLSAFFLYFLYDVAAIVGKLWLWWRSPAFSFWSLYLYFISCNLPGVPKISGTLDFRNFDIRKYSIFLFHQIKQLSSKKNYTKIFWFGSEVLILQPFLETQSFTNFDKSARQREIFCLFLLSLFCLHGSMHGQQCMEVRNAIIPDWNVTRTKRKLTMIMFWEMTIESKLLNQFQWSCYYSFQKTMLYLMKSML